jgi:sodium/potassium uptake antiporter P-type ATPase alpha subunit
MNGLTNSEHAARLARDGPNKLTPPKEKPWILKQIPHFVGGFQILMLAGGAMCMVTYAISNPHDNQTLWLGISLFFVVIVTGVFESYQEGRANSLMAGFRNLTESTAVVIRSGERKTVPSLELVVGDLVLLEGGQKVTADIRIMESRGLKVDNSTLTGEPEPLRRVPECTNDSPAETRNLAFSGTYFTEGMGKGFVFATGDNTVIGSISATAGAAKRPETTLKKELRHFVTRMALLAFLIAIAFVLCGYFKERIGWVTMVQYFIIGVVANIPEGLLPQLTAQLTLVAKRMQSRNVLVKNLEIIETLGCTSCVASDKTGTLTQNRMTVAHAFYDLKIWGTLPEGENDTPTPERTAPTFVQLQRVATLCNRATYMPETGQPIVIMTTPVRGDASETAMLRFVQPFRDANEYRAACPSLGEIPFNSTNKWALTTHKLEDGSRCVLMKGAPERILARCTTISLNGQAVPMEKHQQAVIEANKALARRGERVLAFAWSKLPADLPESVFAALGDGEPPAELQLDRLCFVGLLALLDPPRPGVADSILQCHDAGIQVIMVTGDHPETARSIAKTINIMPSRTREEEADFRGVAVSEVSPNDVNAVVIHTADELPNFTQADWDYTLSRKEVVFARSLPAQKQQIVQELQARGHIVAVTGDGTNDCPALRQAACGVAMGISGSDIAKNAAQVVLLDDNFCSLVAGIQEGRLIFHNMKKCIMYTVTHLMPEIIPFLLLILIKLPVAMQTVMVLCIDLGTELMPSIALAWEEGEANFMQQPPRDTKKDRLVTPQLLFMAYILAGIFETAVCYWGYFWAFTGYGFYWEDLFGAGYALNTNSYAQMASNSDDYNEMVSLMGRNTVFATDDRYTPKSVEQFYNFSLDALSTAQTAYIYGIVICQLGNILCTRSRYESLFARPFNRWIAVGMLVALVIINCVTYVPFLHSVFGATYLPAQYIFVCVPAIVIMIGFDELRKWLIRRDPHGCISRCTDY